MKKFLVSFIVICVVVTMILGCIQARKDKEILSDGYVYSSRMIQNGDTLWDYAVENAMEGDSIEKYIKTVKTVNNMKSDLLKSGEYIILLVPYVED